MQVVETKRRLFDTLLALYENYVLVHGVMERGGSRVLYGSGHQDDNQKSGSRQMLNVLIITSHQEK